MRTIQFILLILFSLFTNKITAQKKFNKILYFAEDTVISVGCGVEIHSSILKFSTHPNKKSSGNKTYTIVIDCPELYGVGFFKKGSKYNFILVKDYKKMTANFSKALFAKYYSKSPNLFYCENVTKE